MTQIIPPPQINYCSTLSRQKFYYGKSFQ